MRYIIVKNDGCYDIQPVDREDIGYPTEDDAYDVLDRFLKDLVKAKDYGTEIIGDSYKVSLGAAAERILKNRELVKCLKNGRYLDGRW
jgi:hypothetical protein